MVEEALSYCDEALVVPSSDTGRIQEVHITAGHALMELIEDGLLDKKLFKSYLSELLISLYLFIIDSAFFGHLDLTNPNLLHYWNLFFECHLQR